MKHFFFSDLQEKILRELQYIFHMWLYPPMCYIKQMLSNEFLPTIRSYLELMFDVCGPQKKVLKPPVFHP